jgi:hypothetical protein
MSKFWESEVQNLDPEDTSTGEKKSATRRPEMKAPSNLSTKKLQMTVE